MSNKTEQLKPCPFCGGVPELITRGNEYSKKRSAEIKCGSCYTKQVTAAIYNSLDWCKEMATQKWNKRTTN
jgi:hypothetical protein